MKGKIFAVAFAVALLCGCEKEDVYEGASIVYPERGLSGVNLLGLEDNAAIQGYSLYSLSANLKDNAVLMVSITRLDNNDRAIWMCGSSCKGWSVREYDSTDNTQTFVSNQAGLIDIPIQFQYNAGKCLVKIYENNSTVPNKIKNFEWKAACSNQ